jgi:trans-2,3-dihydro-3-hydroxyanthranilate isomerase
MRAMKRRYVTADVFTDRMFGGNPLAVVVDAEGLTTAQMQSIAMEFNYSESTFVLKPQNPRHTAKVRIFTPRIEVPFAGHPNVGTAFLLAKQSEFRSAAQTGTFIFEELAGLVPITLMRHEGAVVGAELRAPERLSRRGLVGQEAAAACLSLQPHDVRVQSHPAQVVSVGLPFLVIEVVGREALRRSKPNITVMSEVLPLDGADAVFAYWPEPQDRASTAETQLHARMFSPFDGILEDPATGSACAAAVALLATLQYERPAQRSWRIHQGLEMGRPSVLMARTVSRAGEVEETYIGGCCVAVLQGSFIL